MTNKEIAELAIKVVEAAAGNEKVMWNLPNLAALYENMFKTVKQMDQDNQPRNE